MSKLWRAVERATAVLDVNRQNLGQAVQKALGLQAWVPGKVDERYQLGINALDLTAPENLWLQRSLLAFANANTIAVAAQWHWSSLKGAANKLTRIRELWLGNPGAAAQTFIFGFQAAAPAAGSSTRGAMRDDRGGITTARAAGLVEFGNAAAPTSPSIFAQYTVPAGASVVLTTPWVIGAGNYFTVNTTTVNQAVGMTYIWTEADLLPTEGS